MKRIATILFMLAASHAGAQTACPTPPADPIPANAARLSWDRPAQYTDGSSIPSSVEITYTLYRQSGSNWTAVCSTTQRVIGQTNLSPGQTCWAVTARVGTDGPESDRSAVACKTYSPVPQPPQNFRVSGNTTAYTLLQTRDNLAVVAVGTVAPGTACLHEGVIVDGRTLYVVPRESVTWAGSVRPQAVYAECG